MDFNSLEIPPILGKSQIPRPIFPFPHQYFFANNLFSDLLLFKKRPIFILIELSIESFSRQNLKTREMTENYVNPIWKTADKIHSKSRSECPQFQPGGFVPDSYIPNRLQTGEFLGA